MSDLTPQRRTVLRGGLALGGTALSTSILAACGSDDDPTTGSSGDTDGESGSGSGGSDSGGSGGAGGAVIATAADVPVGGGTILTDDEVVVTQPSEGEFKCFSSICTHQSCPVSSVDGDQIVCSCHGSEFSIADGSVTAGPATEPLPEVEISVRGNDITLA